MADKNILIIDTGKELSQKIASLLGAEGYTCFSALSGEAGIAMAKETKPSLIFVNAAISVGMRGLEICKTIHEMDELNNVPVVIFTPRKVIITERDKDLYGIVDYLTYVFSEEELISKVKYFSSGSRPFEIQEEKITTGEQQSEDMPDDRQSGDTEEHDSAERPELQPSGADAADAVPEITKEQVPDTGSQEQEEIRLERENIEGKSTEPEVLMPHEDSFSEYTRKSSRKPVLIVSLMTVLIVLTAGVILFYDDISRLPFFQESGQQIIRPPAPPEQRTETLAPPDELRKPQPAEESPAPSQIDLPKPEPVEENKPEVSREKQKPEPAKQIKPPMRATPKPAEKTAQQTVYSVQIGVFKNKANATSLAKKFDSKGYHARIHTSEAKDQSMIYRVLIGKFENEQEARKHADTIRSREDNLPVILYRK